MSRIAKIITASATLLAVIAIGSPAVAASSTDAIGAIGCCKMR
jgi:hypothetical protein